MNNFQLQVDYSASCTRYHFLAVSCPSSGYLVLADVLGQWVGTVALGTFKWAAEHKDEREDAMFAMTEQLSCTSGFGWSAVDARNIIRGLMNTIDEQQLIVAV